VSRVFLSYARDDVDAARQLAEDLEHSGHDVWWDRHLHGGSRFDQEIEEALKNAEAVVVLWSSVSLNSAWVKDEAAEARDSERLVPVSIGSAKPPLGFRQFHTIDLGSWNGKGPPEALGELLDAISRICGQGGRDQKASAADNPPPQKASVCVLPFANMSGEPEQEYFSDGISEDITTDLSKISSLDVVARNALALLIHVTNAFDGAEVAGGYRLVEPFPSLGVVHSHPPPIVVGAPDRAHRLCLARISGPPIPFERLNPVPLDLLPGTV